MSNHRVDGVGMATTPTPRTQPATTGDRSHAATTGYRTVAALLTLALTVPATACGQPGRLASGASGTPNPAPWSISTSCDGPDKVWVSYEDLGENGIELGGIAVVANHKDCVK